MSNKITLQQHNDKILSLIDVANNLPEAEGGATLPELINEGTAADLMTNKELIDGEGNKVTGTFTIDSELTTQDSLISQIQTALNGKVAGVALPTLENPAVASDIIIDKEAIDGEGNKITGTFTIDSELSTQDDLITQIQTALEGKAAGGRDTSVENGLITKTLTSYTNDGITYIPESAFRGFSNLTTVNFPAVKTINQYAFAYCSSLTTANFPAATSIGSGAFCSCGNLTTVNFPKVTSIASSTFWECSKLTTANFPAVTRIANSAFYKCTSLTTVSFPVATYIGYSTFQACRNLTTVNFPAATYIGNNVFWGCSSLTTTSFPAATSIGTGAFSGCTSLSTIYLMGSSVCSLTNSNAFTNTGITSTNGSIFVPASLVESYKSAAQWSYFSNAIKFRGIGVLDDNKIERNITKNIKINTNFEAEPQDVSIISQKEDIVSISNIQVDINCITFDATTFNNNGIAEIIVSAIDGNITYQETLELFVGITYTVTAVNGASYTFTQNGEYYEGRPYSRYSYCICKLNIIAPQDCILYLDCINNAGSGLPSSNYGILSNIDTMLTSSTSEDTSNVYYSFKGNSSPDIQTISYNIPSGEHYVCIKFLNTYTSTYSERFKFKVRFE